MQRSKGEGLADASSWVLGKGGLQRYAPDIIGYRYFGVDERTQGFHGSRSHPAFPMLGHGSLIWMFRKSSDVSSDSWDITEVGSGTQLALQDEMGGVAKAITGAVDNNNQRYFSKAECCQIAATGRITLHTRIRIGEPVQCDAFFGFCEKGVNIISGRQNAVGFYLDDGSALVKVETNSGGTPEQEASAIPAVADTWLDLTIGIKSDPEWSTKHVNFFINHAFVAQHKTNIPTAAMALAFGIQNGEGSANNLSLGTTFMLND